MEAGEAAGDQSVVQPSSAGRLARDRPYLLWMIGETGLVLGSSVETFAVPLLALAISWSASVAGLVSGLSAIGSLIGLLPGGVIADTLNKRAVRTVSAAVGLLAGAALFVLTARGWLDLVSLCILAFILQLRGSLFTPTSEAMLRSIVDRKFMPAAVAANQSRDAVISIIGTPVAGLAYSLSRAAPFLIQTLTSAVLLVTNLFLPPTPARRRTHTSRRSVWLGGIHLIFRSPLL